MRIAFDGTALRPGRTGVGYYSEHLLQHLATEVAASGDELVVISNARVETSRPLPSSVRVLDRQWRGPRVAWLQLRAARLLDELGVDVAHFTNGIVPVTARVATVVTIHDMSLRLYPRYHPLRRRLINRPLLGLAARMADAIVTVSHSARHDLLRYHSVPPERVIVVHEAADERFHPITDATAAASVRRRYALPGRFLLYVGAIEPRKNLNRLMEAYAMARAEGLTHPLVCVGPYGWSSRDLGARIARYGLTDHVRFLGYVAREDLPFLYGLADVFVFPSIYEGFGLPVVEAMACGTPVITSRTSSLGEIADRAALTIDPADPAAIASALLCLTRDEPSRVRLSRLGSARARAFSWQSSAHEMLAVYRRALGLDERAAPSAAAGVAPGTPAVVEPLRDGVSMTEGVRG